MRRYGLCLLLRVSGGCGGFVRSCMVLVVSVSFVCFGCFSGSGLFFAVGDGEVSFFFFCFGKVLVALIVGFVG